VECSENDGTVVLCESGLVVRNGSSGLDSLVRKMVAFRPRFLVVEAFALYPGRTHVGQTGDTGLSPVFVTGYLRGMVGALALKRGGVDGVSVGSWARDVLWVGGQMAGQAKKFCPNDKLRALGLWRRGDSEHERDAMRHAVLFGQRYVDNRGDLRRLKAVSYGYSE
jgi:hypothetical protein